MSRAALINSVITSAMLLGSASAQVIESTLEPKAPVNLQITSVEAFQKSLNAGDPAASADSIALDTEVGIAMRATQGVLNLSSRHVGPDGRVQYIVSLIDESSGEPLKIQSGNFVITDTTNNPIDFKLETFAQAKFPASVILLIDASGSMSSVIGRVITEANGLFDRLPDHLHCEAIVFQSTSQRYGSPNEPCTSQQVDLSGITADGGTSLFTALRSAFNSMNARTDHDQKIVLVLTDGDPTDFDPALFAEVESLKGETQVLFFWLGNKSANAEHLFAPLADHYVDDPLGAWRYLDQYFGVFTTKINEQVVVTIDAAKASPATQP